jgi:hypothetical protein
LAAGYRVDFYRILRTFCTACWKSRRRSDTNEWGGTEAAAAGLLVKVF